MSLPPGYGRKRVTDTDDSCVRAMGGLPTVTVDSLIYRVSTKVTAANKRLVTGSRPVTDEMCRRM